MQTVKTKKEQVINGNISDVNMIYDIRKTHFMKKEFNKPKDNPFKSLNLPYHNQILDYIEKQHKK